MKKFKFVEEIKIPAEYYEGRYRYIGATNEFFNCGSYYNGKFIVFKRAVLFVRGRTRGFLSGRGNWDFNDREGSWDE